MRKKANIILLFLLGTTCFYQSNSYAKAIGNNTAVFIVPTPPTFPAADTNNLMFGFAQFKGGFTLQDATTSCTFNSVYPVSGTINMNGGTLYLSQDMVCTNTTELIGLGTIIGNHHVLELCDTVTYLPANLKLIKDLNIYYYHDLDLLSSVTVQGTCFIYGNGNTFDIEDGAFIIDDGSNLEIQNQHIEGIQNISCVNGTGHIKLYNVLGCLTDDWTFSRGDIEYDGNVTLYSEFLFDYKTSMPATIADESNLTLDGHITYKTGRATVNGADSLQFIDNGSILTCNECNLIITASGLTVTKGRIAMNGSIGVETESTDTNYGLMFGDGIAAHDIEIDLNGGSFTKLQSGVIVYNNAGGNGFKSSTQSANFQLDTGAKFYLKTTCTFPQNTFIAVFDGITPPLIKLGPGSILNFDYTRLVIPSYGDAIYHGRIDDSSGRVKLGKNDSIYINSGTLLLGTTITGSGVVIEGNGSITGQPLKLQDSSSSLLLAIQGVIGSQIDLNNGTITLGANTSFTSFFASGGTINLGTYKFTRLPVAGLSANVPITYIGNGGSVELTQDELLTATRTFVGEVTLNCNNQQFEIGSGGHLIVDPSSHLYINNATLTNIAPNSIYCMDDTGTLTLNGTTWQQSDDVEFDRGTLLFRNAVTMSGEYEFWHTSSIPATILGHTQLILAANITYKTGRKTIGGLDSLLFEDSSSILAVTACTFHVTGSGLALTKGLVNINGVLTIDTESTNTTDSLILGNSNASDDVTIYLNPGCATELRSGTIVYNNGNADGFKSTSLAASFQLDTFATLHLATTATFPPNTFSTIFNGTNPPQVTLGTGAILYLNGTRILIPGYKDATVLGLIDTSGFISLTNNDYIYLSSGSLILGTKIIGSGNKIVGPGSIDSLTTFSNSSSVLELGILGPVQGNISLSGGVLRLNADTYFSSSFISSGTVDIQNYSFTKNTITPYGTDVDMTYSANGGFYYVAQNAQLTKKRNFYGSITLDCQGNVYHLRSGGAIIVGPSTNLTIKNASLLDVGLSGTINIYCMDDTGTITLENCTWQQTGDFEWAHGTLIFKNNVQMTGAYTFAYTSSMPAQINANSNLNLNNFITYKTGRNTVGGAEPLIFADSTSSLMGTQCSFMVTANGLNLKRGRLMAEGLINIEITSTNRDTGLIFGDGLSVDNDLAIYLNPGCYADIKSGILTFNNLNGNSIYSNSSSKYFILEPSTILNIEQTCTFPPNTLLLKSDGTAPEIAITPGKTVYANGTTISESGLGSAVYNAYTPDALNYFLDYEDSIYLNNGILPINTTVLRTLNTMGGSGTVDGTITLTGASSRLILGLSGIVAGACSLNGGTLTLNNNISFTQAFSTGGTIDLGSFTFTRNPVSTIMADVALTWSGTNGLLNITQDVTLTTTWTFVGNVTIDLNGGLLDLTAGTLLVSPSTQLTIKNATIANIGPDSIKCTDDTGIINLENLSWVQADDYEFVYGALNFKGAVLMGGEDFIFSYLSTQTSLIRASSTLTLDNLFTFSYAPINNDTTLIAFTNKTSRLALNHTTFYVTPGLELTKGVMAFSSAPTIYALGDGLTFGDVTVTANDMQMLFLDSSSLDIAGGVINYKDLGSGAIQLWNGNTIEFEPTTTLNVYRNMDIGLGQINFNGSFVTTYAYYQTACPVQSEVVGNVSGSYNEVNLCL